VSCECNRPSWFWSCAQGYRVERALGLQARPPAKTRCAANRGK